MKKLIFPLIAFIAITSCNQVNKGTPRLQNDQTAKIDTLCFVRLSGLQSQDTTSLKMIIDGEIVSGQFATFPFQKDSRIGMISGVKTGEIIKGVWHYQQEGVDDSLAFEFMLQSDRLLQKQTSFDENTGREYLNDTASFRLEFQKQDCKRAKFTIR